MNQVCVSCGAGERYKQDDFCLNCGCKHGFFRATGREQEDVRAFLEAHTASDPAKAYLICCACGIPATKLRNMVHAMRCQGLPIGSGPEGYFWARTRDELTSTLDQLRGRRDKLSLALLGLEEARKHL